MAKRIASELRSITAEQAMADYLKLQAIPCDKINPNSLLGNKAMDYYFFQYRLVTKGNQKISFLEFIKDKELLEKPYVKKLLQYKTESRSSSNLVNLYQVFQVYYGTINAFKPLIAKAIYYKYKPTTVVDFSAGWGGRCLGALACGINYIGFDTNKSLRSAYKQMIATYPSTGVATITFKDSATVDYSKFTYDMVFTSPPYYKKEPIETYEHMPEYPTREDFLNKFLYPVVKNSYLYLALGGIYALNIPIYMYEDLIPILGIADEQLPLALQNIGQSYKEYIYIWHKKEMPLPSPTWKSDIVEVRPSSKSGNGVFSVKPLIKNQVIDTYQGLSMTLKEFKSLYGKDTRYTVSNRRKNNIVVGKEEPYLTSNISHYINEANADEDPNVYYKSGKLMTLRGIEPDEELLLKYPTKYPRTY